VFLQFVKYNLVGLVNTLVGFSIILGLMYVGLSATVSNMVGYTIGASISYMLNSKYTFSSSVKSQKTMVKFFMILGLAYVLNFVTLQWLLTCVNPYTAQLVSAIVYTVSAFILAKKFAFKEAR